MMSRPPTKNKPERYALRKLYIKDLKSIREIAEILDW